MLQALTSGLSTISYKAPKLETSRVASRRDSNPLRLETSKKQSLMRSVVEFPRDLVDLCQITEVAVEP
jgi:hypothetical protein